MRYRGEFLGNVKKTSREAAESEAARLFSLSDFHRRRLLLEERLWFNRPMVVQDRLLGSRLGAHALGARFPARPDSFSQGSAELIILPSISVKPNVIVRCLRSSCIPL
jgi:hypothetical protein